MSSFPCCVIVYVLGGGRVLRVACVACRCRLTAVVGEDTAGGKAVLTAVVVATLLCVRVDCTYADAQVSDNPFRAPWWWVVVVVVVVVGGGETQSQPRARQMAQSAAGRTHVRFVFRAGRSPFAGPTAAAN